MQKQLALLRTDSPAWRLDEETREIGRRGVAAARAALRASRRSTADGDEVQRTAA